MSRPVLVVEDEPGISSFLLKALRSGGYAPTAAADAAQALAALRTTEFDLVILDLGLPDMDGMTVLHELRRRRNPVPVIILTARDDPAEMVEGLDAGADDYITKPFRLEVLLARIRARLRDEPRSADEHLLRAGNVVLDLKTRRAYVDDELVELTAREFSVAEVFFRHPDQVLSREQILNAVWGYLHDPGSNVVDVYVGYLRRKLGEQVIETVRGLGYRLRT